MSVDPGLASWLQLTLTPGIGGAALRAMLRQFGLPENIVGKSPSELSKFVAREALDGMASAEVQTAISSALEWAARPSHSVITLADPSYPRALLEISDPPAVIYAVGRAELLQHPALAIVGSRNATAQGEANSESFARALSDAGLTVVSGLAMGIDAAAHRGGLSGPGSTIAVLGTGVDIVYPRRNAELAAQIAERGLLISEFALGTAPAAHNFPKRNRLISGLGRGCLVIEAAAASGSLITARAAAEQGRDVFAIPGSIHSPLSRGCHALIKTGAKLVESAQDVLDELSGFRGTGYAATTTPRATEQEAHAEAGSGTGLLRCMGHDPVDVDALCSRAGLSVEQVSSELLRLELKGLVAALPGGLYQRLEKGDRG
jgi:DNA processing protein